MSKRLSLENNRLTAVSVDSTGFKTVLGSGVMKAGKKYYFEVTINKGLLTKVGIARPDASTEEAFCDSGKGWGLYNGELRHASNSSGIKYGMTLREKDVVGILLDTVEGTLSFNQNGINQGVAFQSEELQKGEFVAACAPFNVGDSVTINMTVIED